jgi:hypothetical protein
MRIAIGFILFGLAVSVSAQSPSDRPLPTQAPAQKKIAPPSGKAPVLQPLPEPPPPPPGFDLDPTLEPQVTIQKRGSQTVEEYRINGRLYMIKVTPAHGVPYYLIDDVGRGEFVLRDNFDTRTRVPMWVIHQF